MSDTAPGSMLEKRRIEAAMLKEVYDVLVERHGDEEAQDVIRIAVANSAVTQGKAFRRNTITNRICKTSPRTCIYGKKTTR